jgi:hypothetical protein
MTILAFLSLLPDVADQHAVLRRRLQCLEQPASFFYDVDVPSAPKTSPTPTAVIARVTSRAERAWLREVFGSQEAP